MIELHFYFHSNYYGKSRLTVLLFSFVYHVHVVLQIPQVLSNILHLLLLHVLIIKYITVEDGGEFVESTIVFEAFP